MTRRPQPTSGNTPLKGSHVEWGRPGCLLQEETWCTILTLLFSFCAVQVVKPIFFLIKEAAIFGECIASASSPIIFLLFS
ncbi:hypothetical protein SLEP1_g28132 [Rubroshorea leprosula]|uniref:Uncharacterized protein n=1 Tax=Rubroshorea leprosula TaxID=152421 RepID=A0AAV5JYA1_9ROSI|nr:hypothetical protein SLEP1_g28132 [Rubroshorea leprosula]